MSLQQARDASSCSLPCLYGEVAGASPLGSAHAPCPRSADSHGNYHPPRPPPAEQWIAKRTVRIVDELHGNNFAYYESLVGPQLEPLRVTNLDSLPWEPPGPLAWDPRPCSLAPPTASPCVMNRLTAFESGHRACQLDPRSPIRERVCSVINDNTPPLSPLPSLRFPPASLSSSLPSPSSPLPSSYSPRPLLIYSGSRCCCSSSTRPTTTRRCRRISRQSPRATRARSASLTSTARRTQPAKSLLVRTANARTGMRSL